MSEDRYLYWVALAQVPGLGARLEARLQAHCAAGGALVLTSHRELEAAPAAHRLLWLDAGR